MKLNIKPTFIQEKKRPCIRHMPFKKRLIYSTDNVTDDQEVYPRTTTPSNFKGDSHEKEMTDSNPVSNG